MRLATIYTFYKRALPEKLGKTIKDILNFHISKFIKASFSLYKMAPSKQGKSKGLAMAGKGKAKHAAAGLLDYIKSYASICTGEMIFKIYRLRGRTRRTWTCCDGVSFVPFHLYFNSSFHPCTFFEKRLRDSRQQIDRVAS